MVPVAPTQNKKAAALVACGLLQLSFVSDYKTVEQASTPARQRQFAHVLRMIQSAMRFLLSHCPNLLSTMSLD
jgi:hypothetical protein